MPSATAARVRAHFPRTGARLKIDCHFRRNTAPGAARRAALRQLLVKMTRPRIIGNCVYDHGVEYPDDREYSTSLPEDEAEHIRAHGCRMTGLHNIRQGEHHRMEENPISIFCQLFKITGRAGRQYYLEDVDLCDVLYVHTPPMLPAFYVVCYADDEIINVRRFRDYRIQPSEDDSELVCVPMLENEGGRLGNLLVLERYSWSANLDFKPWNGTPLRVTTSQRVHS